MKRSVFTVLLVLILCAVTAAVPVLAEKEVYTELTFENFDMTDFFMIWDGYQLNFEGVNLVKDGENTYFLGTWDSGMAGARLFTTAAFSDYTLECDYKNSGNTNEQANCYKSKISLRTPYDLDELLFEPDNTDDDKSSYLGAAGIDFYFYNNLLEVAVHTSKAGGIAGPVNGSAISTETSETLGVTSEVPDAAARSFGAYAVGYIFTLPEGISFTDFNHLRFVDTETQIVLYIGEAKICTIDLADRKRVTTEYHKSYFDASKAGTPVYDDLSYTTVSVKDAKGNEVLNVADALVADADNATIAFAARAANYSVDNILIVSNQDKPEATGAPVTQKPDGTEAPVTEKPDSTEAPATQKPAATVSKTDAPTDETDSSNAVAYVLIIGGVIVLAGIISALVIMKKKNKS